MFHALLIFRVFMYGFFTGLMMPHVKTRPPKTYILKATRKE